MKKILLPILLALVSTVSTGLAFVNAKIETTGQEITYGLPPYEGMKDYKAKDVEEYIDKEYLSKFSVNDELITFDEIIQNEIGLVFKKVLEHAGVYKLTDDGKAAFLRFIEAVNS